MENALNLDTVRLAVTETAGEILCYNGHPIEATYFSSSGGMTEASVAVWGEDIPYLQATESPEERNGEAHIRTVCITRAELSMRLGRAITGSPESWFQNTTYTEGEGVATVSVCGAEYTGTQLRNLLDLRSTAFQVKPGEDCVYITTKGYGHRVGMSQHGANAMAETGSTYRQILAHYYTGTEISNCKAYLG
jgi:stage II sporulation protein D